MPGKVKVKIMSGRNLPVMDRSSDTTDAYVEIKLGSTTYKTDVCRKSLNPNWNSEWYKFEVDDSELQDEPLQIRLMDHDTYSANDAIGKVYVDLNPLLLPATSSLIKYNGETSASHENTSNSIMSGWFPVFDTMHGIRGEVKITVKVELFSDFNKFRQSSCGVQFFCSPVIPHGYHAQIIHGFVEELIVNDDPEYQWIDKIRTPRASNEARQTLFFKLSGELQRKIGVKAIDLGGNAVIGYSQCFDLEGESGIVARGIGTAITLIKLLDISHQLNFDSGGEERAQSYLKFLGSDSSFQLNNEPNIYVDNKCQYSALPCSIPLESLNISPALKKSLMPDKTPDCRHITRHLSQTDFLQTSPKSNIHHSSSLQTLLKQEDKRGTSRGISRKLKMFKTSSQNIFSKKMTALKAKLTDSGMIDETAKQNDTSDKKKRGLFKRAISESNAMAEILVRSVIHAHNSLDCILETHDNTPKPVFVKQQSLIDEQSDETCMDFKGSSELDSYLSLPDVNLETHSTTSCDSSSDDEEEDVSDIKDDDIVLDTVSDIVKNVEIIERKLSLQAHDTRNNSNNLILDEENLKEYSDIDYNVPNEEFNFHKQDLREFDNSKLNKEMVQLTENKHRGSTFNSTTIPITQNNNKKPMGMFQTAMQTILLDKVNLIGTPPISPTQKESFFNKESVNKSFDESTNKPVATMSSFRRSQSPTSLSLMEYDTRETVLGAPFKSVRMAKGAGTGQLQRTASLVELNEAKKKGHFHISFKPLHGLLRHKHKDSHKKSQSTGSLRDIHEKESMCHRITHAIKHRRSTSPSSCSLVDHKEFKSSVFKHFTSLSRRLKHKNHKRSTSPGSVSLVEFIPREYIDSDHTKKLTSFSLADLTEKDSVLGGPFQAIYKNPVEKILISNTHPEVAIKDKGEPNINEIECKEGKSTDIETKETFRPRTLSNPTTFGGIVLEKHETKTEPNHKPKRTRTYSDSDKKYKKHDWEFSSIKSKLSGSLKGKSKQKSQGLLKTALQTVLMESVNDILATSHSDPKENQDKLIKPENEPDVVPSSSIPYTNPDKPITKPILSTMQADKLPINTKIDDGNINNNINTLHARLTPSLRNIGSPQPEINRPETGHHRTESVGAKMSHSPAKISIVPSMHRRSSDSDLSITPKGNSLTGSDRSGGWSGHLGRNIAILRHTVPQENFDIMEYPFLTMSKYPHGFIAHLGGTVSARSVKLLERITNLEEPESRDTWWSEIRMEIRSHARALNCNAVLGYTETTTICEDVCVLSASGTAAIIGYQFSTEAGDSIGNLPNIQKGNVAYKEIMTASLERNDFEKDKTSIKAIDTSNTGNTKTLSESPDKESNCPAGSNLLACTLCHMPYNTNPMPLRNATSKCRSCKSGKVPDVLISTIEIPEGIPIIGRGCFLQSHICRPLKDAKGESNAKEISDGLPFLEYELHRLLLNKLKIKGMNAIFSLKVRISIGERMLIGIATGTAVYLSPLPTPSMPKLVSDRSSDEDKLAKLQKQLHSVIRRNKEVYQLKDDLQNGKILSDTDDSEDEQVAMDYIIGNKDCCILEVDDPEDKEVVNLITEPRPPDGFHVVNSELVPGLDELEIVKNLQMFIQIWRAKIQSPFSLDKELHKLLQTVYFKLRRMIPCALCDLQFRINSPEADEVQLCVLGMALGLGDPLKDGKMKRKITHKKNDEELIFNLEEDNIPENSIPVQNVNFLHTQALKHRQKSPQRFKPTLKQRHVPYRERHGVDITPLSYVPGGKIERYLGNLNFFFIRETTSIREEGGLSGFLHSFVTEVLAIVRAHVTALGGNAMVAYFMTECILNHNLHKNQGQCLINVGGDVVFISYYSEDMQ